VNSLVRQSLQDIEVILVDDGSPGLVPVMCDSWAKKDKRIKVIHKKNEGAGYARNSGLEIAAGEYIAFVDNDDYVSVDTYKIAYDEAQKEAADAVFFGIRNEYKEDKWWFQSVKETHIWERERITDYMLDMIACAPCEKLERKWRMSAWHAVYKRSIIDQNNVRFCSEREVVCDDLPFHIDFLRSARKIVYVPQILYSYCLNAQSITSTFRTEKFEGLLRLHKLLIQKIGDMEGGKARADRFLIGYVRTYIMALVMSHHDKKREIIKNVLNDGIWSELKLRYCPEWLPDYQNLFYRLMLGKHSWLLMAYAYMGGKMRRHFMKHV